MASSHSSNDTDANIIKFTTSTIIDDDDDENIWENIKVIKILRFFF